MTDAVKPVFIHMLTTADNPFNPFEKFDEWFAFDESFGYHSCSLLDRVVVSSDELSEADQHQAIELGILEIVVNDPTGTWLRVNEVTGVVRPGV